MLVSFIIIEPNTVQRTQLLQFLKNISTLKFKAEFINAVNANNYKNTKM